MKKPMMVLATAATLALAGYHSHAQASADGCSGSYWSLSRGGWYACEDVVAIMPFNDTRTNLLLFMLDRDGGKTVPIPSNNTGSDSQSYQYSLLPFTDWSYISKAFTIPTTMSATGDGQSRWSTNGTICQSNDAARAEFISAVRANRKIPANERDLLVSARTSWTPACQRYSWSDISAEDGAKAKLPDLAAISTADGQQFVNYMTAADAFYRRAFDEASPKFAALNKASDPWVREASTYMVARSELNRAQATANGKYGDLDLEKIDKSIIAAADAGLNAYLKAYPKGRYANSANGLKRRVWWLGGDTEKLTNLYQSAFRNGIKNGTFADQAQLVEEIDLKLPRTNITDPLLLAMVDLQRMRTDSDRYDSSNTLSRAELDKQSALFASNKSLFDFLRASHAYYSAKNPKEVLTLIPDAARQKKFTYLEFSRQMLRGQALTDTKDINARGFWLEMIGGTEPVYQRPLVELAIALHDEKARQIDRIFAADSVVKNKQIRSILLRNIAGPDLLRQQATNTKASAEERQIALSTLLGKSISNGRYKEFLDASTLINPVVALNDPSASDGDSENLKSLINTYRVGPTTGGYPCPSIKDTVTTLSTTPQSIRARMCLGEFYRTNSVNGPYDGYGANDGDGSLGSSPSLYPGSPVSRLDIYQNVIANRQAPATDRAYALYRAVQCYAPSGSNACGGKGVAQSQRKAWFLQLKREYPNSQWAKEARYYW